MPSPRPPRASARGSPPVLGGPLLAGSSLMWRLLPSALFSTSPYVVYVPRVGRRDRAVEAAVPRRHRQRRVVVHHPPQVLHDLARVVVRHRRRPAGADPLGAVDEHHRQDRQVPLRLDLLAVVLEVLEEGVVVRVEDQPRERGELGEDVPRRRRVLAAEQARAELARRVEERVVVRSDVGLRHPDDRAGERRLAVVVRRVLGDVPRELRHLDLVLDDRLAALEARVQDLALPGLRPSTIDGIERTLSAFEKWMSSGR